MLKKNSRNLPNNNWKKVVDQLVIENCLAFGDNFKFTQKKVARYLLGTRSTFEIFKLYELRYLLLKVYPFIQNLFYNPRLNSTLKTEKIWNKNYKKQLETQRKLRKRLPSNKWKPRVRIINSFVQKEKNLTPQVLFATVTPKYTDIIKDAAQICNMPSHENRWLNGSITAAISYQEDHMRWNYITDEIQAQTVFHSTKKWGSNKENPEKTKEKLKYHGESRWPSLIIIPDLSNNVMILKEAKKVGLPVMGLVNSSTPFEIDYPIFAQEQTIQSVHFFCHFLATLIAKEIVYIQHKRYILQKKKRKLKSKIALRSANKKMYKPEQGHLMPSKRLNKRLIRRNSVFFRIVRPINNRKVVNKNWHTEYSTLQKKGRYFYPRFRLHWQKNLKNKKKSRFGRPLELKYEQTRIKKHPKSTQGYSFKVQKIKKKVKIKRKIKNSLHLTNKFTGSIVGAKKKIYAAKKIKFLKKKFFVKSKKNIFKRKSELKPLLKPLQPRRFLKIMGRYLKKKRNQVLIIKKQKYLSLILHMKKRVNIQSRPAGIWKFLKQEAFKKRFSLKKKFFFSLSDQKSLWKKIHKFLILNKLIKMQKKNKFLLHPKLRLHTHYKNYYGARLKQSKQVTRFNSFIHTFRKVFKYRSYKTRLAEKLYYDAHPAEWRAEKARRYRARQYSQKPSKKKNWAKWAEKNVSQQVLSAKQRGKQSKQRPNTQGHSSKSKPKLKTKRND